MRENYPNYGYMEYNVGQYDHDNYGLMDYQSDCENTVRSYPPSYVFAGSRFRWSGNVATLAAYLPGGSLVSNRGSDLTSAVRARGYYDVRVSPSLFSTATTIDFSVPVDQSSRNDVQANIEGAVIGAGYKVSGGKLSVIYTPSISDVCKGVASSGAGSREAVAMIPKAQKGLFDNFFGGLGQGLGISTPVVIAGVAIAAYLLLKR